MKTKKKGCRGCFLTIFIIFIGIVILSLRGGCLVETRTATEDEPAEVEQVEETTKVEETKDYELDFIGVKRLKKEFGDALTNASISIAENNDENYTEQMRKIDEILTELELKKKVGVKEEVKKLYDLFIEDIKTTVDMLIAESIGDKEEYEELNKKVMELDEKFLNEYHRIENKLK